MVRVVVDVAYCDGKKLRSFVELLKRGSLHDEVEASMVSKAAGVHPLLEERRVYVFLSMKAPWWKSVSRPPSGKSGRGSQSGS
ncbi:hypothetical protein MTO96_015890 [Rhipicephalus appendiculatus]